MKYAIETRKLEKRYGLESVVKDLDLRVPEGSVYGFIGPNGAGKTTTMKMILGLCKPTAGKVIVLGQEMNEQNRLTLLRKTGSLIESPSCYGHLTARENLEIVAELKGVEKKDIDRVLDIVHLKKERTRRVRQFSLGMRQRLGIAQALLGEPKALVLDEPTNGLDPAGIQEMREMIASLPKQTGATVLISSHLLGELEQFIDHVGVIGRGRLLFQGTLDALRQRGETGIQLRVLESERARLILHDQGVETVCDSDGTMRLPVMEDESLARVIAALCQGGAGVVQVVNRTQSLEDIFLALTAGEGRLGA